MRFIAPLSLDTRHLLERIRKSSRHAQTRDRAHAILLSAQHYTVTHIMDIFHITRITVYRWFDAWEDWALIGLYDNPGRGRTVKLTWAEQYCVKIWGKMFPRQLERVKGLNCALVWQGGLPQNRLPHPESPADALAPGAPPPEKATRSA